MNLRKIIFACLMGWLFSSVWLLAAAQAEPVKPFPPFRVAGNLYYVGDEFAASYLITTPRGNILINTSYSDNLPMLKASIAKLGLNYKDTKILLISHAHNDHAGASAQIKAETHARYMVMQGDVSVVESGGKTDFLYGSDPAMLYPPAKVDRVLHDGEQVRLGNVVLIAHLTPGHTKGSTTWTMSVTENGKKYHVVMTGSTSVNPGCKLVNNPAYPNIAQDYQHMFKVLKSLPCDIFLGSHGSFFDLPKKYALLQQGAPEPFVDAEGYKNFVASKEQEFKAELAKQQASKQ